MNTIIIKRNPNYNKSAGDTNSVFASHKDSHKWVAVFSDDLVGDVFGHYHTKNNARRDCAKHGLTIA